MDTIFERKIYISVLLYCWQNCNNGFTPVYRNINLDRAFTARAEYSPILVWPKQRDRGGSLHVVKFLDLFFFEIFMVTEEVATVCFICAWRIMFFLYNCLGVAVGSSYYFETLEPAARYMKLHNTYSVWPSRVVKVCPQNDVNTLCNFMDDQIFF